MAVANEAPCRPKQGSAASEGSAVREATSVGVTAESAGPPQARPAPSGGSAVREATSVAATAESAGPPQARPAPSEGSAVREATSVGATFASTVVTRGVGVGVGVGVAEVQAIASATAVGRIGADLTATVTPTSALQQSSRKLVRRLGVVAVMLALAQVCLGW